MGNVLPGIEGAPSTHLVSTAMKSGATTAEASAVESAATKTATAVKATTPAPKPATTTVPSARPCRRGIIGSDRQQDGKQERNERAHSRFEYRRLKYRHGTLRFTKQGPANAGPDGRT